jgi:nitrate/nitrite-specific signal transduction histidine kinase
VANLKQLDLNHILGRMGVRLWALFVLGTLLSVGIVILMIIVSVKIVEQPTTDTYAQIDGVIAAGAILMLVSAAAIVFTGFYISRRIMRPIAILRQGAAQLAAGKFDSRIEGVKTGDELEFLADEFNDLATKLQMAQTSITEAVREREEQYQSAQHRVHEMSALLKSGRAITSLDLESVLDNLARESAGTAGADRCAIYVLNETQHVLALRGWWDFEGLPRPSLEYEIGEGVIGWTARESKPLFLANAQADQRFVVKWEHDRDVAAIMNLPLIDDGVVVGVLQVSTRPGTPAFTREDQRLLASFADQSAVAIKNAQLYEMERRRAQEMALVAEINRTISLSLDLDTTLNSILASRTIWARSICGMEKTRCCARAAGAPIRSTSNTAGCLRACIGSTRGLPAGWRATAKRCW